jgi:protein-S-isoprenylcysteine O-methyltransferase Ste14
MSANIRKRIKQLFIQILAFGVILFISAGSLTWAMGWAYLGISIINLIIDGYFLIKLNPEVISERAELVSDRKPGDNYIIPVYVMGLVGSLTVPGLDYRFGWSEPYGIGVYIIALVLLELSNFIFLWSMVSNKHFAGVVRIREEGEHAVMTGGPYRYIRHPGYLGQVIGLPALPVFLGSLWGLVPAGLAVLGILLRTAYEDRTLHSELTGYPAYAQRVRYRLLPGVW